MIIIRLTRPLCSVDELKKVCGWEDFTSKPGWEQDFTCRQAVALSISLTHRATCYARCRACGDDAVDRFLQLRHGPDGIDGTADEFN